MPYKNKENASQYALKYRLANADYFKEKYYAYSQKNKKALALRSRQYRKLHIEKVRARNIVSYAIRKGVLIRGCCAVCRRPKAQAHHENYNNPFAIVWLCKKHHMERHRKLLILTT